MIANVIASRQKSEDLARHQRRDAHGRLVEQQQARARHERARDRAGHQQLNADAGLSILVAEQSSALALRYAHRAYVLETGRVALSGAAAELRERDDIKHFYLGTGADAQSVRRKRPRPPAEPIAVHE